MCDVVVMTFVLIIVTPWSRIAPITHAAVSCAIVASVGDVLLTVIGGVPKRGINGFIRPKIGLNKLTTAALLI